MKVGNWINNVKDQPMDTTPSGSATVTPAADTLPVRLFAPPGHFYSPIVNPAELGDIQLADAKIEFHEIAGIKIDSAAMIRLWNDAREFLKECPFPENQTDEHRYYFKNNYYSFGDAIALYMILRSFKPRRLVEVGSGFSSACALDTIDAFSPHEVSLVFIEPYADRLEALLRNQDQTRVAIVKKPVQQVDLSVFEVLGENDILFIDSTHVSKTGSDVNHLFFNVLPRLKPGVLVHIHDIFFPFEYGSGWVKGDNRSWNEAYLLKAFLMYNSMFEIVFFNDYFRRYHRDLIEETCPNFLKNAGGAIWLRRRAESQQ